MQASDWYLLCELTLELNRQGFGRLRCFPQEHPSGMAGRCCVAVSPLSRPSTSTFWQPIWWYGDKTNTWTLPPAGAPNRDAASLAADRGPKSFLACVVGSTHSAAAIGDSGGYEEWLADILKRPERIVPILLWNWYETPSTIQTLPVSAASLNLPFPPGFHKNVNSGWREQLKSEQVQARTLPREQADRSGDTAQQKPGTREGLLSWLRPPAPPRRLCAHCKAEGEDCGQTFCRRCGRAYAKPRTWRDDMRAMHGESEGGPK